MAALASLFLAAACAAGITEIPPQATATRTLGHGEQWVPVALDREIGGVPVACAGTGWVGGHVLTGSPNDRLLVWMMVNGQRQELEWPVGYSARFTPQLELLDQYGNVVAGEGTQLVGGCQMAPNIWDVDLPCPPTDAPTIGGRVVPYCNNAEK